MLINLKQLAGNAIAFPGQLQGLHAIVSSDVQRVIALIVQDGLQQYILYLSQMSSNHLTLEVEAITPDHPLCDTAQRAVAVNQRTRARKTQ